MKTSCPEVEGAVSSASGWPFDCCNQEQLILDSKESAVSHRPEVFLNVNLFFVWSDWNLKVDLLMFPLFSTIYLPSLILNNKFQTLKIVEVIHESQKLRAHTALLQQGPL